MVRDFGFYGILTNPGCGYERLAEVMVRCRVCYIQLRMKDTPREVVYETALRLRDIIGGNSLFIVNDDVELAREVAADGVHIGQDDMKYDDARRLIGPEKIIGISTHNPAQTQAACALRPGPDYIGVGPVYATPTKRNPDPVIGLDGMHAMLNAATLPAVAIGGINFENIKDVLASGARNVCAVRCVNQAEDPEAVIRAFQAVLAGVSGG